MSEAAQNRTVDGGPAELPSRASGRHVSIEERRRLVAESLRVGNPGNNSTELPAQADPRYDCQIELAVDDIRPYESNPRRAENARFAEIKESIRSSGIRNPLTVTRRPGDGHFIVEAGGNTRLLAIQQLWSETREPRFQKLVVLFRPWRSESHVLTSHLIENELRGEMTFWDRACGVVALKVRLEAEKGHALSLRQLEDEMKAVGLSVNTATLAHCLFAIERLRILGEVVADLSGLDVKTMQPRLNAMKRYAQTRTSLTEDDLYDKVFGPVFQNAADQYRGSRAFSAAEVCAACVEALARQLGEPAAQLRKALDAPAQSTQPPSETSPARLTADRPVASAALTPTPLGRPARSESAVSTANGGIVVSGSQDQREDALSPIDKNAVVRSQIIEHVRSFAGLAGIGDCLRLDAAAPLGFYMHEAPEPDDEKSLPPSGQQAWWLLALVAGQLEPSESMAASVDSCEGNFPNPCAVDPAFLGWLVDAQDERALAFWNVLALVRASRSSSPARRPVGVPDPRGNG